MHFAVLSGVLFLLVQLGALANIGWLTVAVLIAWLIRRVILRRRIAPLEQQANTLIDQHSARYGAGYAKHLARGVSRGAALWLTNAARASGDWRSVLVAQLVGWLFKAGADDWADNRALREAHSKAEVQAITGQIDLERSRARWCNAGVIAVGAIFALLLSNGALPLARSPRPEKFTHSALNLAEPPIQTPPPPCGGDSRCAEALILFEKSEALHSNLLTRVASRRLKKADLPDVEQLLASTRRLVEIVCSEGYPDPEACAPARESLKRASKLRNKLQKPRRVRSQAKGSPAEEITVTAPLSQDARSPTMPSP